MKECKFCMIAGPDDKTEISQLIDISLENKVEWGILYRSESFCGKARFPTRRWIDNFIFQSKDKNVQKSLHLCGEGVYKFTENDPDIMYLAQHFDRVQLNFNAKVAIKHKKLKQIINAANNSDKQIIIQHNRNNKEIMEDLNKNIHILLDASGGIGKYPKRWTNIGKYGTLVGYAGGIKPSNIRRTLASLKSISTSDFWIDLESGVRTNNEFDIDKVKFLLKLIY